jgi:hypothetical protein
LLSKFGGSIFSTPLVISLPLTSTGTTTRLCAYLGIFMASRSKEYAVSSQQSSGLEGSMATEATIASFSPYTERK